MPLLRFIRRTLSRYADDRSVRDFERVLEQTKPTAYDAALDADAKSRAEYQDEVEKIVGVKLPKL